MKQPEASAKYPTPCRHLRSKEMFYQNAAQEDEFCSGVYWCTKTHEGFGPDGEPAGKVQCCASRPCYIH